jgi:(R,R)-butanediol dehydrogenase/meso-butanediol dehydrogenase/diacetyl reductase
VDRHLRNRLHEYIAGPIVTPATPHVFTSATLPQTSVEFSAEVPKSART